MIARVVNVDKGHKKLEVFSFSIYYLIRIVAEIKNIIADLKTIFQNCISVSKNINILSKILKDNLQHGRR